MSFFISDSKLIKSTSSAYVTAHDVYETDISSNTPLHRAILCAERKKCLQKIKFSKYLNQPSLGNTPLLLALKVGLFDIALALILEPETNVLLTDKHGFSPLHYACLFRQEEIIEAILARHSNIKDYHQIIIQSQFQEDVLRFLKISRLSPFWLYTMDWSYESFDFNDGYLIADRPSFRVPLKDGTCTSYQVFSDLLFHCNRLCKNLNLIDDEATPQMSTREFLSTEQFFRTCIAQCLPLVIDNINSKAPAEDVAFRLSQVELSAKHLKHEPFKKRLGNAASFPSLTSSTKRIP